MSTASEFARPRRLDTLGAQPLAVEIAADERERAALADRFGLIALDRLEAQLTLVREGEIVTVTGRIRAALSQPCVATGEPVHSDIDEPLLLRFVPEEMLAAAGRDDIELGATDCDVVAHDGGQVDLGEAVAETLALSLDPFPRSAGAAEALRAAGVLGEGEAETGPFAGLAALRDRLADKN